jgi:hypothetical protein
MRSGALRQTTTTNAAKRSWILVLALLVATPAAADDFFAPDKLAHWGSSTAWGFIAGTATYHLADEMGPVSRTLTSTALGTLPGLGVEIGDALSKGGRFSWGDLGADAVGAFTGAIFAELVNGQFFVSASGRQIKIIARW